jgi:hypothetical protein
MSFRRTLLLAALVPAAFLFHQRLCAQQIPDTLFNPKVGAPAFDPGTGPTVLIDEGHHNFHTMEGRYLTFARLLRRDGCVVRPLRGRATEEALAEARILVISNALAAENETEWTLPTPSAFDSAEVAAIRGWVGRGGSLWLIADHMPFPGAAGALASEFGVLMGNGFALDPGAQDGRLVFTRASGLLADHPITKGGSAAERVDSVVSFTGQAFRMENGGGELLTIGRNVVLQMPSAAWQFSRLTPSLSASGMLQGAAFPFGRGRVAVFGEAAMFSAQLAGPGRSPAGMNDPVAPQNAQFLLNVLHWLSGSL